MPQLSVHLQVAIGIIMNMAFITAYVVKQPYLNQTQNLILAVVGLAISVLYIQIMF
jgi:hypothetical protein